MTEYHPVEHNAHTRDYLPAAGRDAFLPGYDLLTRVMRMNPTYDALISQAELSDGMRVLEIGCGTGNVTIRAKRAHPLVELVGSDPDPLALTRARRKAVALEGLRFEEAYAQNLPYADGEFDRVLSSAMFHHLDAGGQVAALAEVFRVLRPGGRLHLVDFVGGTRRGGLSGFLMRHNSHAAGNFGDTVPRMMRAAGFEYEEVAVRPHHIFGPLTFFRATRPA